MGEVGREEEEEEAETSGRREGNTIGDGEDVFALGDEDEDDTSGDEDDTTPWEEDTSSDSEATPPSGETSGKEAYRSPVSNSSSCFTQGGQVHIHVHVTGEDVAGLGLSGDGLNVVCNGLLG